MVRFLGEDIFTRNSAGELPTRIATVFPATGIIVTAPPIHALQYAVYEEWALAQRAAGTAVPGFEEERPVFDQAVDLIVEGDTVYIRPNPANMDLAFRGDLVLQEIVPKHRMKYRFTSEESVRQALQRRGELWRIQPPAQSPQQTQAAIESSLCAIEGVASYYYSWATGTRWLTCQKFSEIGRVDDEALRRQLIEISTFSRRLNARGYPEVAFFMAEGFGAPDFDSENIASAGGADLRAIHNRLVQRFRSCVSPNLWADEFASDRWRKEMYCTLSNHLKDWGTQSAMLGLADEFFMQVAWLPGGHLEEGTFAFDPALADLGNTSGSSLPAEDVVRGLISALLAEYHDLEYINLGSVTRSLAITRPHLGRRNVFVAEYKRKSRPRPIVQIMRMQKWGVYERLENGDDLVRAMIESEEYTEFILDRRLASHELGVSLPPRLSIHKLTERYYGKQRQYHGTRIWSTYFRRDYVPGLASDKIPKAMFLNQEFSLGLAKLLGEAAAANLIIGRCREDGQPAFDDGDEVVLLDSRSLPAKLVVSDPTASFFHFDGELYSKAPMYAQIIKKRFGGLPGAAELMEAFAAAFEANFRRIQTMYLSRKQAFHDLFRHRHSDGKGNFADRWEHVLVRLGATDPARLAGELRLGMNGSK